MSDDLTARLRRSLDYSGYFAPLCTEAADRIDALTAERDRLREALGIIAAGTAHQTVSAAVVALRAPSEPPCSTCGGSGTAPNALSGVYAARLVPCPDCTAREVSP